MDNIGDKGLRMRSTAPRDCSLEFMCGIIVLILIALVVAMFVHERKEGRNIDKVYEIHKVMYTDGKCKGCHK
jgi:hypothetical protein